MAEKLASRKNQWVQKFLDGRKGKGSWDQRLFPEGVRLCEEVTRAGLKVEACYFSQRFGEAEARRFGTKDGKLLDGWNLCL